MAGAADPPEGFHSWVEAFLPTPQVRAAGLRLVGLGPGLAVLAMPARPEWCGDPVRNLMHTGCLSVLADTACGMSVGTLLERPASYVTLDLRTDYLRAADAGRDLVCRARCLRLAGEVAFVRGELRQEGGEELVACTTATFMRASARTGPAGRTPDGRTPDGRTPDGRTPDGRTPDGRTPDGRTPDGRTPGFHPMAPALLEAAARAVQPAVPRGRSPYVDYLGIVQHGVPGASPVFRLPFREDLVGNPAVPSLHGGVLAGFGETAMILHMAAAGAPPGGLPKGVDFAMDYLRPALTRDTFAQAVTLRRGSRVALVQAILWQGDPARPIALARGHCLMGRT